MNGDEFVTKLKEYFSIVDEKVLAELLGQRYGTLQIWKSKESLSSTVIARAFAALYKQHKEKEQESLIALLNDKIQSSINTLVEYVPIEPHIRAGAKGTSLKTKNGYGQIAIRNQLEGKYGIYLFYCSLGRPIYVGKAKDTELWTEMNSAYDRDLKKAISLVNHPKETQKAPKQLTLSKQTLKLYDVAAYTSAYEVEKALINKVEALLIRAFVNELANVKVENLGAIQRQGA